MQSDPPPSKRKGSRSDETREERKRRRQEKRQRREECRIRRETRASDHNHTSPPPKRSRTDTLSSLYEENHLTEGNFVWKKKIEQQRRRGEWASAADDARRREELAEELEETKRRRAERDRERAEWEEQRARIEREREQEENADWHRAEASFHGTQHFLRQAIRIRQGRPVGSDVFARNLRLDLLDVPADVVGPVQRLQNMGDAQLDVVAEDVEKELDFIPDYNTKEDNNVFNRGLRIEWWECVKRCVENRLQSLRDTGQGGGTGVHGAVNEDLEQLLQGKSFEKLKAMEQEVFKRLQPNSGPEARVMADNGFEEVDFWTAALSRIRHLLAEQRLSEMNDILLKERAHRFITAPKEEKEVKRQENFADEGSYNIDLEMERKEEEKGMGIDEEKFTDEVDVPVTFEKRRQLPSGYAWNDKYRPRKPRYYNRVHTGYDWTKYNRTHYDHDNPPPKTVQGYRFNIFYPDLIEPSMAPTYTISRTDNPEVSIITFKAGPPYEDLAFKIVNRPWEHSHRRGYRCSFDRGILQLWFNFQRYRYRR